MTRPSAPARAGAAAVVFDRAGRILVVKENYDRRRYSLPGGALEAGETPEAAVVREAEEETGATVAVDHLIGVYTLDNGFTAHVFRCHVVSGGPSLPETGELSEVAWYDPQRIPRPVSNVLHYALPDAVAGARAVVRNGLARVS